MNHHSFSHVRRLAVVSVILLLTVSVLAGTVYAVTLDKAGLLPVGAPAKQAVAAGGSYNITVTTAYADSVNDTQHLQTVEIYNDTSEAPVQSGSGTVTYAMLAENTSPTFNVKSNNLVSVTGVVVKDSSGTDITASAFGSEGAYQYFLESTKTSPFGFFELYGITGNITVEVSYGEPITDLGNYNSSNPMYSITVVTKGDTGAYHTFAADEKYAAVGFNGNTYSNRTDPSSAPTSADYALDTTYGTGAGSSGFTYGTYKATGQCSNTNPGDGTQMTRYAWSYRTVCFDYTNYSYISDIKAYYQDGSEAQDIDLSSLVNQKEAHNQNFTYYPNQHGNQSVTFVVTYAAPKTRAVYTQINNADNNKPSRLALSCPDVVDKNIFSSKNSTFVDEQPIIEGYNPLSHSSTGLRLMVADANTLRYALTDMEAQKDSVTISNVHIYRLDLGSNTASEEITSAFDGKITVGGNHSSWNGSQYLEIDVSDNDDDLFVSFDAQYYVAPVRIKTSGAHTDSITVTAKDSMGRIGAYNGSSRPVDTTMTDSFTMSAEEQYVEKWFYSDAVYIIKSSGSQKLQQASLNYYDKSQSKYITNTSTSADDGKTIEITIPKEIAYKDYAHRNTLTVTFESEETKKAQVYIAQNGADASYSNLSSFVKVSTIDGSDQPTQQIFREDGSGMRVYTSVDFKQSSEAPSSSYAYQISTGATVKVDFTFDPATAGTNYNNLSDELKAMIQSRIEFKGFKIRKMSGSTPGAVIQETSDGNKTLTFTMPSDSDIRIEPVYHDHFHGVNIIANDKNASNQNYRIDKSTRGSATLKAKNASSRFNESSWSAFGNAYHTNNYFTDTWSYNRSVTTDGTSYLLTVTPKSENGVQRYRVKSVTAYQYTKTSTPAFARNASRNYAYEYNMPETSTWIAYNSSGSVTNTPLDGVLGTLSTPDENGTVTCDVTLPYDMDKNGSIGNIILYVEFEEIEEATVYAPFKYEVNKPEGASSFNPRTVIKYENSNIEGISTDFDITDGKDCKVVYYDTDAAEAVRRVVNILLGGSSNAQSAFYYTNLVYTLTSYDGTVNYGSFRYFKDTATVIADPGNKLAEVIDTTAIAPSVFSPDSRHKACSLTILTLKVPRDNGLKITCAPQETYVPVSVSQYVVDNEGTVTAAGDSFSASVTKYTTGNDDDYVTDRFFTQSYVDDYYSKLNETNGFTDSFTVSGSTVEKHNEALNNSETGYYIKPVSVPDGYEIAAIECQSYDRDNNAMSDTWSYNYYDSNYTATNRPGSILKNADGYRIRVNSSSTGYARSWRQEVKVYYAKTAKLTVHQHLNEALSNNNNIATVNLTNQGGTLVADAFTPYIDDTDSTPYESSVSIITKRDGKTSLDGTEYYWKKELKVNKGTVTRFTVTPSATRSISAVRVYRLVDGEKTDVPFTTVSGTGSAGAQTVYQLENAFAADDDIHIDITYAIQTTLRVKAVMLNDSNSEVENNVSLTKATVDVTGYTVNADSTSDNTPFRREGETDPFGSFTVQTTESVLVYGSSGTNLTIQTNFSEPSDYVVANVKMRAGDSLSSSYSWNWITGVTPISTTIDGETAYNYNTCTVSGLTAGKNTEIIVYLLRTAKMNVSVYTYDTSGTAHEGVPNRESGTGEDTGSYVNVKANSGVNAKAVITKYEEGNYNTGEFRLTYGQNFNRQVNVIQGSTLEVFSMLPDNGDYVVKKIEGTGFTTGVGKVEYTSITQPDNTVVRFLKTTINTNGTISPNQPGGYDVKIYIAPAKSVITRARTVNGDSYTKPYGTVKVYADNAESGVVPFIQIYPSASKFDTNYYTASTAQQTTEPYYTTKTKTQAGTNLHFTVKPDSNYMIQSVDVRQGSESGSAVKLRRSRPEADGTVTYTLLSGSSLYAMPALEDVYIDVVFAPRNTGKVRLDYQYTEDYTTWKPFFGEVGTGTISATNSSSAFKDVLKLTNLTTNTSADSFGVLDNDNIEYSVVTGSTVTVTTSNTNYGWYIPVEATVTDKNGAVISSTNNYTHTYSTLSATVNTDDELTFHVKFIPVACYYFKAIDNNVYDGSPDNVVTSDKTNRKALSITATNSGEGMSNPIRSNSSWSSAANTQGQIAKDSTITDIVLDNRNLIYPGKVKSVSVYRFEKGADYNDLTKGEKLMELSGQYDYPTYGGVVYSTEAGSNVTKSYQYDPHNLTVEEQKVYVFYVEYDCINIYTTLLSAEGRVRPYLVYADDKNSFNISTNSGMNLNKAIPLTYNFDATFDCQFSRPIKYVQGPAYFVLESSIPREELSITSASYKDYKDDVSMSILEELKADENYRTVITPSGAKRYYYIYEIHPNDNAQYPVDNSMEFKIVFHRISNPGTETTPEQEDKTSFVTVTQYDRVSYTDYNVSREDTAVVSHKDGSALKLVGDEVNTYEQIAVPNGGLATVQMISEKGKELKLDLTPREGYNVEKLVITDGSKTTLYPKHANPAGSDTYSYKLKTASATIDIYYAQPTLRVTATNKAEKPNAAVDVIDGATTTRILKDTDYTNDMLVTKGENKIIRILPSTYVTEQDGVSVEKKYTVDYIAIGDSYDNVLPIYDAYQDEPNLSEDYQVEKDSDGNYTLTLNSIEKDSYVFIQLMGETRILTSALEVRHHIYDVNLGDYVDCSEENIGGTLTTYGVLSGTENPLTDSNGMECSSFVLPSDTTAVTGGALAGTNLSFGVTDLPENFKVDKVEGKYGDSSTVYTASLGADNRYRFGFNAPNSGVLYVDVYYGVNRTPFTLNYVYQGRKGGNTNGSFVGDDLTYDTKTYTKNVELVDALVKDGKPVASVLVDNAPAIDDIYKNCVWTIDEEHVAYGENNTVTINAVQKAREYHVQFIYDNQTLTVENVALNELVKDSDDNFIQAPANDGENDFAYWKVEQNGKEISRCSSRAFNLRITGDCTITACYEANAKTIHISEAEYSRQQYTDGETGDNIDKLYADFILSYMDEKETMLNPAFTDNPEAVSPYQTGLIIEYDKKITLSKEDAAGATLSDSEKVVYGSGDVLSTENARKLAKGESPDNPAHEYVTYTVATDKYNNRNRIDKAISFINSPTARHLVLRAYYYVWNTVTDTFEMTEPVYFYLYDIGNSVSN